MIDPEIAVVVGISSAAIGLWLTARGLRQAARDREMRHTERVKALERGFILDEQDEDRQLRKGLLRLACGLGVAVPMFAVLCASAAVINMPPTGMSTTTVFLIWTAAASIGVAGLGSGAWLAGATFMRFRIFRPANPDSAAVWRRSRTGSINHN